MTDDGQRRQHQRRQGQEETDGQTAPPGVRNENAVDNDEKDPGTQRIADRLADNQRCPGTFRCLRHGTVQERLVLNPGEEGRQGAEEDQLQAAQSAQRYLRPPPQQPGHRRRDGGNAAVKEQAEAGKKRRYITVEQIAHQQNERRNQREQGDEEQALAQQTLQSALEGRAAAQRHGHAAARRTAIRMRTARRIAGRGTVQV